MALGCSNATSFRGMLLAINRHVTFHSVSTLITFHFIDSPEIALHILIKRSTIIISSYNVCLCTKIMIISWRGSALQINANFAWLRQTANQRLFVFISLHCRAIAVLIDEGNKGNLPKRSLRLCVAFNRMVEDALLIAWLHFYIFCVRRLLLSFLL